MEDNSTLNNETIIKKFKIKSKSIRKRSESYDNCSDEEEFSSSVNSKIEEMKIVQKLRQRQRGVDVLELEQSGGGHASSSSATRDASDPFKVKSGGMINMKNINVNKSNDDAYDVGIGTQFSAETNKRDEDEEMMKYIDEQLSKKVAEEKGQTEESIRGREVNKYLTPGDAALLAVPDHLRSNSTTRSEEMLSNQMLSGIPEVDLGIESKIRNIEATEEAKLKLLLSQRNKPEGPSEFVPTNITVNFASKSTEDFRKRGEKRKLVAVEPGLNNSNEKSKPTEKATDDLYYERFKKQFRR